MNPSEPSAPTGRTVAAAYLAGLAGVSLMLLASFGLRASAPELFMPAFWAGFAIMMSGALWLTKKSRRMPRAIFGNRRRTVRRAILATSFGLLAAAAGIYELVAAQWSEMAAMFAMACGVTLFGITFLPYQIWALGFNLKLDEYHLNRRRRARDWAYSFLAVVALTAGVAVIGLEHLSSRPVETRHAVEALLAYFVLFTTLPGAILAWTEPDIERDPAD